MKWVHSYVSTCRCSYNYVGCGDLRFVRGYTTRDRERSIYVALLCNGRSVPKGQGEWSSTYFFLQKNNQRIGSWLRLADLAIAIFFLLFSVEGNRCSKVLLIGILKFYEIKKRRRSFQLTRSLRPLSLFPRFSDGALMTAGFKSIVASPLNLQFFNSTRRDSARCESFRASHSFAPILFYSAIQHHNTHTRFTPFLFSLSFTRYNT